MSEQQELKNRLLSTMERKRNIGLRERAESGGTNQLPIFLAIIDQFVLEKRDWLLFTTDTEMASFITSVAAELGLYPVKNVSYYAWDTLAEDTPRQPDSNREIPYKLPKIITTDKIPRAAKRTRKPNADGEFDGHN